MSLILWCRYLIFSVMPHTSSLEMLHLKLLFWQVSQSIFNSTKNGYFTKKWVHYQHRWLGYLKWSLTNKTLKAGTIKRVEWNFWRGEQTQSSIKLIGWTIHRGWGGVCVCGKSDMARDFLYLSQIISIHLRGGKSSKIFNMIGCSWLDPDSEGWFCPIFELSEETFLLWLLDHCLIKRVQFYIHISVESIS